MQHIFDAIENISIIMGGGYGVLIWHRQVGMCYFRADTNQRLPRTKEAILGRMNS